MCVCVCVCERERERERERESSPNTSPTMKTKAIIEARMSLILAFLAVLSTTLTWQSHRIGSLKDLAAVTTAIKVGSSSLFCDCL